MKITEQEIVDAPATEIIPGAKWLGGVYGDTDDWRIFAVPIRSPSQSFVEATAVSASTGESESHG